MSISDRTSPGTPPLDESPKLGEGNTIADAAKSTAITTERQSKEPTFTNSPVDITAESESMSDEKDSFPREDDVNVLPVGDASKEGRLNHRLPQTCGIENWNVGNRYQLVKILGLGSFGEVAEAYDNV